MARPRSGAIPETPKVLDKALRVLGSFSAERPELTEGELSRELALPTTTVNRIARGLEEHGYVLRTASGYRLGPAAARLGRSAAAAFDIAVFLRPVLVRLAQDSRETVILAVPDTPRGLARYVAAIESPRRLRIAGETGEAVPLTAGATARAILAALPDTVVDEVLARPIEPTAIGSIVDAAALRRLLDETRRSGWALSWQETYDGAWAVAAAIPDEQGVALGAIGIAAPTYRHTPEVQAVLVEGVRSAAAEAATILAARRA